MESAMMDSAQAALDLSKKIQPLLAGHGAGVQGAVLGDLVSIWLAGHPRQIRERILEDWLKAVRELTVVSEEQIEDARRARRNH
jgi:hypothetical protein